MLGDDALGDYIRERMIRRHLVFVFGLSALGRSVVAALRVLVAVLAPALAALSRDGPALVLVRRFGAGYGRFAPGVAAHFALLALGESAEDLDGGNQTLGRELALVI